MMASKRGMGLTASDMALFVFSYMEYVRFDSILYKDDP